MERKLRGIDIVLLLIYFIIVLFGILNIYSVSSDFGIKQLIWFGFSILIGSSFFFIPASFFEIFSFLIYSISIILLILLFPFGAVVNGSKSWFKFGLFSLQPVEIAKIGTTLTLGYIINTPSYDFKKIKSKIYIFGILIFPIILILLQPDIGSALVFSAFFITLYREGLPGVIFLIIFYLGILFFVSLYSTFNSLIFLTLIFISLIIFYLKHYLVSNLFFLVVSITVSFLGIYFLFIKNPVNVITILGFFISSLILALFLIFENMKEKFSILFSIIGSLSILIILFAEKIFQFFPKHHRQRIIVLFEGEVKYRDTSGYNLLYSKTSIGSGGIWGKGFNKGTVTDGKFVPEQHTDYIFSVVGEEWGFVGSSLLLIIYAYFIIRVYFIAEKQRAVFNRVIGYSIASIFLIHFIINIGMVIGLFPTIGIPLPYFSYGGSSLIAFSIMFFIFLRLNYFDQRV